MRLPRMTDRRWMFAVALGLCVALTDGLAVFPWLPHYGTWVGLLPFPLFLAAGGLWAFLIRTIHRRMTWVEFLVIVAIVFVLECLMLPAVVPDHSRRQRSMPAQSLLP
jgi:hypothetical protein